MGHQGKFGHEFLELELHPDGLLRYANDSAYKRDRCIRKEVWVSRLVVEQVRDMVLSSKVLECDDSEWPAPDVVGRQELEVRSGGEHVRFVLAKIGSMAEMEGRGEAGEGMKALHFLVQDLRAIVFSLIALHFKVHTQRRITHRWSPSPSTAFTAHTAVPLRSVQIKPI